MSTLGIIAGGGELPHAVAQSVAGSGRKLHILALRGIADEGWLAAYPHEWMGVGELGRSLKLLAAAGAKDLILVGQVDRPAFSEIKLDARGLTMLPSLIAAARKGDDALMKTISDFYAREGFAVLTAADAAPGLVTGEGPLGKLAPDAGQMEDIKRAFAIVRALGAEDVGQAAIVCEGLPLCVEAAEGTDAMIARVATLRKNLRGTPENKRGVLVKALKPMQDRKTDLPVIGVNTVRGAHAVGLAGIALEAGVSLIVDKTAVAAAADRLGLFVTGIRL
ncbi:MAG TPA: UDP-2,3-diacylglucosamine diphosphatase LpxI [Rhizomicrobium sp.]|nr:UDP-2,3-diacylglucosamine diphosphatase LpxI [Rhizomicrobium sp.]